MNDSIIINAISKIQFILVSIFSFIFLVLFISFIVLQKGIYIDSISFQNVKIEKLYIKWDEKVSFIANEIHIANKEKSSDSEVAYEKILSSISTTLPFLLWFEDIFIEHISVGDTKYTFEYIDNQQSLSISSSDFILYSSLFSNDNLLHLKIDIFRDLNKNIQLDGDLIFDAKNNFELSTKLNITIHDDTKLHLFAHGDRHKLSYKIESDENIKNTREIIDLFNVNPNVKYWIYDAIEMSSLSLNTLYGWFEYKNLDKAYLNLYAKAVANDLKYTYDKKVDSVRTTKTDLEFKEGVLYIKPQNAYSYNFFLDKSWLKIDFSKKEELLTLYLLFKGQVNKNLLSLLERYEIKLPFIQNSGAVDTNLTLDINLITLDVEAVGDFYAKEAQINYLGLDIDISDAHVFLNNYDVKVKNMVAKYGDIATSHVDLDFDANESSGALAFRFDTIEVKESDFKLLKNEDALSATYFISPKQDYITIEESTWSLKGQTLHVNAMQIPFDIKELAAKIPLTAIESPNLLSALVSGEIFFNSKKANLNIELSKFSYLDILLDKKASSLNLLYDTDKFTLSSAKPIQLDVAKKKATLDNFIIDITPEAIKAKNLSLNFENILSSKISIKFNVADSSMSVDLRDIDFENDNFGEIFKNSENIRLFVENRDNSTTIRCDEFNFNYLISNDGWRIELNSIDKITEHSNILKKYNLTNGKFVLYKKNDEAKMKFSLNTDYKYKILVIENTPLENYTINGEYEEGKEVSLKINDLVDVKIEDDIHIKTADIGINLDEILNFVADKNSTEDEEEKKSKDIYFEANNSYLYLSENRHIISDTINLQYINEELNAKLTHKQGKATLKLYDDVLNLYGENFNDEFMGKLFSLSKFKGGFLEFYINGSTKEYSGTLYVRDTTILDYKILNNILAFVNTVPSLVTFSLPGYNQNGIAAKSAYMNFKYKDEIYKINDIYLKSKEIEIVGLGEASIKNNSINMDLSLITGIGSSVSKIPFIGHILLGRENISTTLKLSGALENPDVNTQVTKDIAAAPFNIIKRTLMYPFEFFDDDKK
ncbi:AsmA-like C-terminal domain-containing protein [Sulfurimonas sp.]|uniref:YhdP family protein n=1 Tax=Sulfurimonas sp. TaxID=2022749 RepID=UPI0026102FC8|nr:AsmA-like C-terminal domain-containing protein [Sulfurimonas sp.]MDD3856038.1 AsmA-like C-terminal domain-containing protein [Sulfurimonas sp.]